MEFLTGLGMVLVCSITTFVYAFNVSDENGDDRSAGVLSFVIVAIILSIIFAIFIIKPESFGYQKIVSGNEVVSE